MNPIATGLAGALISGLAMYTVGATTARVDALSQNPALVQPVDGQFAAASYTNALRPVAAPAIGSVGTVTPANHSRSTSSSPRVERPVNRQVSRPVDREDVREVEPERTWGKTAMIVGGSAAGGAGVGGIVGGKKGALIGAAIGGGAASIYEATQRR